MDEYRSPLKYNSLLNAANKLREQLPFYIRYRDDIEEDSGLEAEEVEDGYGETDNDR